MAMTNVRRRSVTVLGIVWLAMLPITLAGQGQKPGLKARILQSNSAGDYVSVIDPVTDTVIGKIEGIEVNHAAAGSLDGSKIFVSGEAKRVIAVADAKTFKVFKEIPLSGRPNNIVRSKDGKKLYVAIHGQPGGVDVIDTNALTKVKNLPLGPEGQNRIHNPFITPDGKFLIATTDSATVGLLYVVDTQTDEVAWKWQAPPKVSVRPADSVADPDGSTKYLIVNISGLNGFVVVDWATHKEIKRVENPFVPEDLRCKLVGASIGIPTHGVKVSPDMKQLWVSDRWDNTVQAYSLPDFTHLGFVPVGLDPMWMSFTPDAKKLYVANSGGGVTVVDTVNLRKLTTIEAGWIPKRNQLAMLQTP